jgi:hypothetical protein
MPALPATRPQGTFRLADAMATTLSIPHQLYLQTPAAPFP